MSQEVLVYANWMELVQPALVGTLRSDPVRGKEHFSFTYADDWLQSPWVQQIDPQLSLYQGEQHKDDDRNFRIFLDSCPDRWGRLLMKRREAARARQEERPVRALGELDYLLGVHDLHRQGALRFKQRADGEFLDNSAKMAVVPIASLSELEYAAGQLEADSGQDDPDYLKWLTMLMSPGSSLGGARPKASVIDEQGELWIAKFPSRHDDYDMGAWEYLVYLLAREAGVDMAESRLVKLNSHHHTFMTRRFDRKGTSRLHFTSAMTQLGYNDGDVGVSFIELARFLTEQGANTKEDLAQLWRRIVFYIAVSNADCHLRNHGFILEEEGWTLSPAFDVNAVSPAAGLHLNITEDDNRLDYALATDVIDYFQLGKAEAVNIHAEVLAAVGRWQEKASDLGIGKRDQTLMESAFRVQPGPRLSMSP